DEVRVRALGSSMTPSGSPWIMDDVTFGSPVTPNDPGDVDIGPNGLQNAPFIASAVQGPGGTTVDIRLSSKPNTPYTVEVFSNDVCDPSGFGQGRRLIGTITAAGNQSGDMTFNNPLFASGLAAGQSVTATARETQTGNTSEFSNCVVV